MADKYLEQYERMRRSYDRFRTRLGDKIPADYEDDIYAFFMHCYHLKDWLKNDSSIKVRMPNIATDVEQFIERSAALGLCAELCHSLKPLQLKRSLSQEKAPQFGREQYHNRLKLASSSSRRVEWLVERTDKSSIDAFELATECIAEWDKFLLRLREAI